MLVVAFPDENVTRIISASKANRRKSNFMKHNYDFSKGAVIRGKIKFAKKQAEAEGVDYLT